MSESNSTANLFNEKLAASENKSFNISIPLGRQLSCCDSANLFKSYIINLFHITQDLLLTGIVANPTLLNQINDSIEEILQVSIRILNELASGCCNSSCCIEAARAVALVSIYFLTVYRVLLLNIIQIGVDVPTTIIIVSNLLARFNKTVRFINEIACSKNCVKSRKNVNNIIETDNTTDPLIGPTKFDLAPIFVDPVNPLNIDTCCEAIVSSIGEAYRRLVIPPFVPNLPEDAIDILNNIFLNALKRLYECSSCVDSCCLGTSEGILNLFLTAVTRLSSMAIKPSSSTTIAQVTSITNEMIEEQFTQDTNSLLKTACRKNEHH